jgi:23S rRNA pseudouridine1911/1915/1917 synthase
MVEQLSQTILYADDDILILNKPAGVVVNQAIANREASVQEWFAQEYGSSQTKNSNWQSLVPAQFDAQYGSPEIIWSERQGIVHRLDKDTSGVLVLALNPGALVHLLRQFQQRQVHKKYCCLVHGGLALEKGIINAPLQRAQRDRRRFAVTPGGREAVTLYTVLQRYSSFLPISRESSPGLLSEEKLKILRANRDTYLQGFCLVECEPKTGRTHQIRVHLAHTKHPIVGDNMYVGKNRAKLDALWCPRQFLHAQYLEFTHPRTGATLQFTAPLPTELDSVLQLVG